MGTDIHGVIEQRTGPDEWVTVRVLANFADLHGVWSRSAATARNYERFSALAGVRYEGAPPRGIPDNASETVRYLFEPGQHHSASWLPLDDATLIFAQTDPFISPENKAHLLKREQWTAFNSYYFSEIGEGDDYRLVFWFDN